MSRAQAAQNSMAKSRSETASSEFSQTLEAQFGGDEFAVDGVGRAGQRRRPRGRRLVRLRQSAKRSPSRPNISK